MIGPKSEHPSKSDEKLAYALVTERDGNTCQRCLRDCGPIARDHRQNRQPGNTTVANLQLLGLRDHIWKTEHPREALVEGWAVPSWADPLVWPARRWRLSAYGVMRPGWCLLDNQGGVHWITDEEAEQRMGTVK